MTGMEAHQPESLRRVERWGVMEQTITEREGQPQAYCRRVCTVDAADVTKSVQEPNVGLVWACLWARSFSIVGR